MNQTTHTNPFNAETDNKRHSIAQMLLSGDTLSWTDLSENVGALSPRTMGAVLRALEGQGATILRLRHPEHGTLYRYDPACRFDAQFRISKADGPDALRELQRGAESDTEEA